MASFVSKSACRGHRPTRYSSARLQHRSAIVSRLLRERSVARFLVAPDGYGKTCAALEYAQTIFEFEHVFWISCDSPCFVRDLDANSLVRDIFSCDEQPKLVVFDGVHPLDIERASQFSLVIDSLIDAGCEVLVCCVPSADVYSSLQRDRLRLSARDLLLTDSELAEATNAFGESFASTKSYNNNFARHIAAIGWPSGDDASARFLKGLVGEDLPLGIVLTMFGMFVLGQGSFETLSTFVSIGDESLLLLEQDYPHFGVDRVAGNFSTLEFPIAQLAVVYRSKVEAAAACSLFADRDLMSLSWAETLLENKNPARACETVRHLCSQRPRGEWLLKHNEDLLNLVCVLPSLDALESLGDAPSHSLEVTLAKARRYVLLSGKRKAAFLANRLAFNASTPIHQRMQALIIVARNAEQLQAMHAQEVINTLLVETVFSDNRGDPLYIAESSPQTDRVHPPMVEIAAQENASMPAIEENVSPVLSFTEAFDRQKSLSRSFREDEAFWAPLGILLLSLNKGAIFAAHTWMQLWEWGADSQALSEGAAWILQHALDERSGMERDLFVYGDFDYIERYVRNCVSQVSASVTFADTLAALSLEHARSCGLALSQELLTAHDLLRLHDVEMAMFEQRNTYKQRKQDEDSRRADKFATHPDSYLDVVGIAEPVRSAPLLDIKLFGGMEVYLGGERIDIVRIKRNKVKTLLAILVLARGRDVSKDAIVRSLWPDSNIEAARRNFYTIWSCLHDALELSDGTCPYLISRRGAYAIDIRLVRSDIKRFDAVCRKLQFGVVPHEDANDLYSQIDEDFMAELLPAEEENAIICATREECRSQLIDALIGGAGRLMNVGETRQGLWLARLALRLDPLREDAYLILIMAQSILGQRTAAIMSFFKCKRMLSEQLGLDPSPQIQNLYDSLIDPPGTQGREPA